MRMSGKMISILSGAAVLIILTLAAYYTYTRNTAGSGGEELTPSIDMDVQEDAGAEPASTELTAEERDWERYRNINDIRITLSSYINRLGGYPAKLSDLVPDFISEIPADPASGLEYHYVSSDGSYTISFILEGGVLALAAGAHTLTPGGFDLGVTSSERAAKPVETIVTELPPEEAEPDEGSAGGPDSDNDGLTDNEESVLGTSPDKADTDGDGLSDGAEVRHVSTDPKNADSDGDNYSDGDELYAGYDPLAAGERLEDSDGDGLADLYETLYGYDPNDPDMDKDGLSDGDELRIFDTKIMKSDSDDDGYTDASELTNGYEPLGPGPLSAARKEAINTSATGYGLHPPTNIALPLR